MSIFRNTLANFPGGSQEFPLPERAWEIVQSRRRLKHNDSTERIFPYISKSVGVKHTKAKNTLSEQVGKDLRFQDMRYEAVCRLLEKKHQPHEVARATGQDIKKVIQIFERLQEI